MAKTKTVKSVPILRTPITENEVKIVLNLGKQHNFEITYLPFSNQIQIVRHDFVYGKNYSGSVSLKEE